MEENFCCYHTTTKDRVESILKNGLLPNSKPTWFTEPTPYVMLSKEPWLDLNGEDSVVLKVTDPAIKLEYFDDPEGLRWPYKIEPQYITPYDPKKAKKMFKFTIKAVPTVFVEFQDKEVNAEDLYIFLESFLSDDGLNSLDFEGRDDIADVLVKEGVLLTLGSDSCPKYYKTNKFKKFYDTYMDEFLNET